MHNLKHTLYDFWERLEERAWEEQFRHVEVDRTRFTVAQLPEFDECPGVYFETGLPLHAKPRYSGIRYRFVLLPTIGTPRWNIQIDDIQALIAWSESMGHLVTLSTFKSGASVPESIHAQSFPRGSHLSYALCTSKTRPLVLAGEMRSLLSVGVDEVVGYPLPALRVTGAPLEVSRRIFDLAANYFKAFNLVIKTVSDHAREAYTAAYFIPRRRDGKATFEDDQGSRWQVSAIEAAGLIQARSPFCAGSIDAKAIVEIFKAVAPDASDLERLANVVNSF